MAVINEKQKKGLQSFFKMTGETTHDTLVIARAYSEAAAGNIQAMRFIADLKGEITSKTELSGSLNVKGDDSRSPEEILSTVRRLNALSNIIEREMADEGGHRNGATA